MNIIMKRVGSLFLALTLALSFSLQTIAATKKPALTQEHVEESTVNQLSSDSLTTSTGEGLVVEEEKPQPEPELKPDPKPDEVTLGASGEKKVEVPVSGPTITPRATEHFNTTNKDGFFVSKSLWGIYYDLTSSLSFDSHDLQTLPPGAPPQAVAYDGDAKIRDPFLRAEDAGEMTIYNLGEEISVPVEEGLYTLQLEKWTTTTPPQSDSANVYINIVETTAVPAVSSTYKNAQSIPVNPTYLTLEHTGATVPATLAQSGTALTYEWEIVRDSDSNTIDSGTMTFNKDGNILSGAMPSDDILKGLETGSYTLKQKSVATTAYGNHTGHGEKLPKSVANFDSVPWKEVPFIIVKPDPETVINDGAVDKTNPTELDPVTSPTKIKVNSKHPLNSDALSRNDETQASAVTWELFKSDGVGGWDSQGPAVSFMDQTTTADVSIPTDFGDYKVVVSETIAGVTDTAEGYYRFPSSHIKVEYWIDDGTGTLKSSETWSIPAAWPTPTEDTPASNIPTTGMTIPNSYELIRIEEILAGITNDKGNSTNGYLASYPADGETTTIKYIYREKATLVVEHLFFEADGITASSTPTQKEAVKTDFVGEAYTTSQLTTVPAGYILNSFANSGNVTGNYVSGETKVTYSYKKAPTPIAKGTLEVKHIFLDDKGNVVTTPATITNNYTENVGTAYTTTSLISSAIPDGYRLVASKLPTNATGTYKTTPTVVEYYYEPIPKVQPGQSTITTVTTVNTANTINPQTGDSTNQENILNALYIVLISALAVFVLSVLVPRKNKKR